MNRVKQTSRVYALLADGTTVEIRPATPDDFDLVKAMHEAMSSENTYLRAPGPVSAQAALNAPTKRPPDTPEPFKAI
jgi:hypothetical protein